MESAQSSVGGSPSPAWLRMPATERPDLGAIAAGADRPRGQRRPKRCRQRAFSCESSIASRIVSGRSLSARPACRLSMISGGPYTAIPITRRSPGHARVKVQISQPASHRHHRGVPGGPRSCEGTWQTVRDALAGCRSPSRSHGQRKVTSHSPRVCRGHRIRRAVIGRQRLAATQSESGPCCLEARAGSLPIICESVVDLS